ncbi:MAG: EamA family transporter [Rhodospirillales bacterium]|nr:EamA family transporter [Rhodospirillales bacterium]MBO6788155.1 EamA family transporter [Rhodospirillales bacterium]
MQLDPFLIAIVLVAALTHASWNALVKFSGDRLLMATCVQGMGTLLGSVLVWFVPLPTPEAWPFIIASVVIHTTYHLTLINAYRVGDLSFVYPLARGAAPLMIAVGAAIWASEFPNGVAMFGIALVSIGIMSMGFEKALRHRGNILPFLLALLVGLHIAAYSVVDGIGIRNGDAFSYIVWLHALEGLPFYLWIMAFRRGDFVEFVAVNWKPAAMAGVLAKLAYGLVLYAFVEGALASVTALRETSVLFAAVIGALFLGERFGWQRWLAAVLIVSGVIVIQLSG